MNTRHLYLTAFIISIGFIIYNDAKQCKRMPWPPRLIYTGVVFGILDVISGFNEEIAGVVAIGFTVALILKNGFVGECTQQFAGTGQVQTTAFIGTPQPASYQAFQPTGTTTTGTQTL